MSGVIHHFLLVYDHKRGELLHELHFGVDREQAMAAYATKEREHLGKSDEIEIVLIGSDSIETVRLTHANYYDRTASVSRFLAGLPGV
jgi:hypothetical protein